MHLAAAGQIWSQQTAVQTLAAAAAAVPLPASSSATCAVPGQLPALPADDCKDTLPQHTYTCDTAPDQDKAVC